jgi:hypothetical protein
VIAAFVLVDKVLKEKRHVAELEIAASAQFPGDVLGDVLRPFLGGVEGDDPDRAFVLPLKQVEDHGFQIGGLSVGFTPDATMAAEVIQNEVTFWSSPFGTIEGTQPDRRIRKLQRNRTGIQAGLWRFVPKRLWQSWSNA